MSRYEFISLVSKYFLVHTDGDSDNEAYFHEWRGTLEYVLNCYFMEYKQKENDA